MLEFVFRKLPLSVCKIKIVNILFITSTQLHYRFLRVFVFLDVFYFVAVQHNLFHELGAVRVRHASCHFRGAVLVQEGLWGQPVRSLAKSAEYQTYSTERS